MDFCNISWNIVLLIVWFIYSIVYDLLKMNAAYPFQLRSPQLHVRNHQ